jgi:multidrug efflux pump subunit AcrB
MLAALAQATLRFRFLIVALAAGLMIVGLTRLPRMPVDVLPETSPVLVELQTDAPGLSAQEVESLVTVPLEKTLLEGVMGVVNVTSDSIAGLSSIVLQFAPGTNLYQARQLVQERLSGAFVLPNVSKPPVMLPPLSTTSDVMLVGLTSQRLSQIDLSVLSRWTVVPRLLGVAGVANVSTFGQADMQLQVQVNPTAMAARHVSLADVVAAVGNSQLVSPLSYLQGSTPGTGGFLENQNQRLTIRHILPFGTPADLGQIPVPATTSVAPASSDTPGSNTSSQVLLNQVATVAVGHQPLIGQGLVNGRQGLVLVIQKRPGASVTAVTSGIRRALAQLRPALTGVTVDTSLFQPASYLASAQGNVLLALIIAGMLAVLALAGLVLSSRVPFIVLASIALSLVAATLILQVLGYSFNSLVLLGLVLALSVVVHDAVVREPGGSFTAASFAALLTVGPIFVASGLTATFLHPMVVAFALAIGASMVIALTVAPALTAIVTSSPGRAPRETALAMRIEIWSAALLRRALHVRARLLAAATVLGILGVLGLSLSLPELHPSQPTFSDRNLVVSWAGAPGMSLPELDRISALASRELLAVPGVQNVAATLGRAVSSQQIVNTNAGDLWVTIRPGADYDRTLAGIKRVVDGTPGMSSTVSTYENEVIAGVLTGSPRTETVRVYGPDLGVLSGLASHVRSVMADIGGLHQVHVVAPVDQPTINVEVNLTKALDQGLAPGDVRREAGTMLSGLTVGNFFEQQKVFDVVVLADARDRSSLGSIQNMLIDNGFGGQVRLSNVAGVTVSAEPTDIQHQAMSPYLDVTATLKGNAPAITALLSSRLSRKSLPLEYHAQILDTGRTGSSPVSLVTYALAALLGIILVAQAVLDSWRIAVTVIAAAIVPAAAAAGVAVAMGYSSSLSAAAGLLGVLALALRQAIGVAARISRRRSSEDGPLNTEALVDRAAGTALPTFASCVVAAVLLVPFVAAGTAPGNELVRPAAVIIMVGLAVATLVNLFVLPAVCLIIGMRDIDSTTDEAPEQAPLTEPPSSAGVLVGGS